MKNFISLVGLVGVLAASAALDVEFFRLRTIAGRSLDYQSLMQSYVLITLAWALLIGLLAWWVLFRAGRNIFVSVLFVIVGLLVDLLPMIYLAGISQSLPPRLSDVIASVIALTIHAGIACMIIGAGGLLWRKKPA